MAAFINGLLKMNMRGVVIILIVMAFRFLLKRLRAGHKYIVGLWAMAFLFFVLPWKVSLPVGFWGNTAVLDEIGGIGDGISLYKEDPAFQTGNETVQGGQADMDGADDNKDNNISGGAALPQEMTETAAKISPEQDEQDQIMPDILAVIWLTGLCACFGHMLYSYLKLKRKLAPSILWKENIWWAENIDMPMVFGMIRPQVYLPVGLEEEDLSHVIAHEEMHIRRKDGLFKMAAYAVCMIHWFNPFLWAAYILLSGDLEKACDEEVIRNMGKESRKEYAYALVHIASGKRKRKTFIAPMGFDEGNLKSRVKNVMKYKYTLPGLGAAIVAATIALAVLFMTEAEEPWKSEDDSLPAFCVEDLNSLAVRKSFSIEDCYITNRRNAGGYYFIDEDGVLWGTGRNSYGQFGTGTYGFDEYYEEPVKIAENVVSVDGNTVFCIYLTDSGELYGVGANYGGILLGKGSEVTQYSVDDYRKVTEPVLLMTDVTYARAGEQCIVALRSDGSAYWWGAYSFRTLAQTQYYEDYWRLDEDDANPVKMYVCEPRKVLDDCIYITTGDNVGAAINKAGELYVWGLNIFGQCGVPVTEDDYIREPVKVMDDVKMVWMDRIAFSDPLEHPSDYAERCSEHLYNTFVLRKDDTLMGAGINLGDKERLMELGETVVTRYEDSFVPVWAVEYSSELHMQVLRELEFGMTIEEAEEALINARQFVSRTTMQRPYSTDAEWVCLRAEYNQYICGFDNENRLESILIMDGGSRDGRFSCGISLSELQDMVEGAGGELAEGTDNNYIYEDMEQHIRYNFRINENIVTSVWEIVTL